MNEERCLGCGAPVTSFRFEDGRVGLDRQERRALQTLVKHLEEWAGFMPGDLDEKLDDELSRAKFWSQRRRVGNFIKSLKNARDVIERGL